LHTSVSSHFVVAEKPAETLRLDGETWRLKLDLRYGISDDWEIQLELPWLSHRGGKLDSLIDNWHDLWGMPDGGRSSAARNDLAFRYRAEDAQFNLTDSTSGIGDITLAVSRQLVKRERLAVSGTLGHKFATGSERDLLGSGSTDTYVAAQVGWSTSAALHWYGQAGYLRAGTLSSLGSRQRQDLWFAGFGLEWQAGQNWSLLAQLDTHRAPLRSATTALGATSWRLTTGARWRPPTGRWSVDVSIVEDVRVATAPDIIFQVSLKRE
jgi:hypothetical protein